MISVEERQLERLTLGWEGGGGGGGGGGGLKNRGSSSLYGFTTLIGWYSGKVIDTYVKSKY